MTRVSPLLVLLLLGSCAGWQEKTRVVLKYKFEAVKTAKDIGVSLQHARCMQVARECKAKTPGVCPALKPCQDKRHKIENTAIAINRAMAAVLLAVAVDDKAEALKALPAVVKQVNEFRLTLKKLGVL